MKKAGIFFLAALGLVVTPDVIYAQNQQNQVGTSPPVRRVEPNPGLRRAPAQDQQQARPQRPRQQVQGGQQQTAQDPRRRQQQRPTGHGVVLWKRVEAYGTLHLQSPSAYSLGPGFAFVPRFQLNSGISIGAAVGASLAKAVDHGIVSMGQAGAFANFPFGREIFFRTGAGLAFPVPNVEGGKAAFPYFGGGVGYRVDDKALVRNVLFKAHYMAADSKMLQMVIGAGLGW